MDLQSNSVRQTGPYTSKAKINSKLMRKDVTPDGNLEKLVWKNAQWVRFDHDWAGKQRYPGAETRVASRWTSSQVYFAFWCKYSTLNIFRGENAAKEKYGLWEKDVVEVFLNPEPRRVEQYYEFEVAPNNMWIDLSIDLAKRPFHDESWNSRFLHATQVQKGIWTCEMRIPVATMTARGFRLRSGTQWRVNFYRADGEGDNARRRLLAWSPTLSPKPNFHVPTRFGLIHFVR
ncbi:MAG: carbohydrate-binding family 9-like protein [Terriglobia bacterium]